MALELTPSLVAPLVAVVDIGKSNAKLLIIDSTTAEVIWSTARACKAIASEPLRQLDIHGIEQWLLESLGNVPQKERIQYIVPIAHGAAAVLLDSDGSPLIAPDYEDSEFDSIAFEYQMYRDPFSTTYSPELGQGLNLGRQLYYLQHRAPELFARCHHIVLYPQYWAYRLSGVLASEISSLGCHTDLWNVRDDKYAGLAEQMGWPLKLPLLRNASDSLGTVRPEIASQTGLNTHCRVLCGLHDSNASYLCHLIDRPPTEPFAAISSGTWTVVMARGIDLHRLHPDSEMLANIDVFGKPVGTARFMGGREYALIAGAENANQIPTVEALHSVLANNMQIIPGHLVGADYLDASERASLATLYVALMSDLLLEQLDAKGDVVIDGPLATNPLYCQILATLRTQSSVQTLSRRSGAILAALYLAGFQPEMPIANPITPLAMPKLLSYRTAWRAALPLNLISVGD